MAIGTTETIVLETVPTEQKSDSVLSKNFINHQSTVGVQESAVQEIGSF